MSNIRSMARRRMMHTGRIVSMNRQRSRLVWMRRRVLDEYARHRPPDAALTPASDS